jgi:hypothetical protein
LALAFTIIPENCGNLDPISKFVKVKKALAAIGLQVVTVQNSIRCAYELRDIATSIKTGDGQNE